MWNDKIFMNHLKQIHAHTLRNAIDHTKFLITKLLQIPDIPYAQALFNLIPKPSGFLYNKLIQAYSSHGPFELCFSLYKRMRQECCPPNPHTFTFLFTAYASLSSLRQGQMLHTQFIKFGLEYDQFILTAMIDMYSKSGLLASARQVFNEMSERDIPSWNSMVTGYARCGKLAEARELFASMPSRNVVSWTGMISGYSQNGQYEEALALFIEMMEKKDARPNFVTIASVLPACANLGALEIGEKIEGYARENGFMRNVFVSHGLLEMYAKCGRIDKARRMFDEIGSGRNLCCWNTMIMGLAIHGRWKEGLELFDGMLINGTAPDDITFVGLLLACTHGGLLAQGRKLFESMERDFSITPKLEHYGCMVDLLGRAGELKEAYALIKSMPMKPDAVIWGTLLGACSFHGSVQLAEKAAESLFDLEPWNAGNYVILANIYASTGQWDGVAKVRKRMKCNQVTKAAGYSVIEENGCLHKFIVEDRSHPRSNEIFELLDEISGKMKLLGCLMNFDSDVENDCIMEGQF
ncbi:pentatricopeptide repeat-containing protein At5g08510-like isoform X1 [Telopea speciosissima]|uniref:pentatricopeptide repeat-containing protein At5g08510-like isoform X1 n=1 Tax=Telopea speciosissima TaxID=54955 RepID=UPI001CC80C50|nr:pentatricopeptide repeat-containing protein At5g08510-like isoform X1 [Telopea speciosissima]